MTRSNKIDQKRSNNILAAVCKIYRKNAFISIGPPLRAAIMSVGTAKAFLELKEDFDRIGRKMGYV